MPLPKDKCPSCGNEREFGAWVAAHWDLLLDTTCEKCDTQYSVRSGRVVSVRTKKK